MPEFKATSWLSYLQRQSNNSSIYETNGMTMTRSQFLTLSRNYACPFLTGCLPKVMAMEFLVWSHSPENISNFIHFKLQKPGGLWDARSVFTNFISGIYQNFVVSNLHFMICIIDPTCISLQGNLTWQTQKKLQTKREYLNNILRKCFITSQVHYGLRLPEVQVLHSISRDYTGTNIFWSVNHDVNICHDVLVSEPFNFKSWSSEGGKDWEKISQELNAIQNQKIQSHYLLNLKSSHKMLTKIKRQKRKRQLLEKWGNRLWRERLTLRKGRIQMMNAVCKRKEKDKKKHKYDAIA